MRVALGDFFFAQLIIILGKCLPCCHYIGMTCISWCSVGEGHRLLEAEKREREVEEERLTEERTELEISRGRSLLGLV